MEHRCRNSHVGMWEPRFLHKRVDMDEWTSRMLSERLPKKTSTFSKEKLPILRYEEQIIKGKKGVFPLWNGEMDLITHIQPLDRSHQPTPQKFIIVSNKDHLYWGYGLVAPLYRAEEICISEVQTGPEVSYLRISGIVFCHGYTPRETCPCLRHRYLREERVVTPLLFYYQGLWRQNHLSLYFLPINIHRKLRKWLEWVEYDGEVEKYSIVQHIILGLRGRRDMDYLCTWCGKELLHIPYPSRWRCSCGNEKRIPRTTPRR